MSTLVFNTDEELLDFLLSQDTIEEEVDEIKLGRNFSIRVRLEQYNSEVPAPQIDALYQQKRAILQLISLIENQSSDIKSLSQEQLSKYEYSVAVTEGSSNLEDNFSELATKAISGAIERMTGEQLVFTVLGVAVIVATTWGVKTYIQSRAEVRRDEIASGERQALVAALVPPDRTEIDRLEALRALMSQSAMGEAALSRADDIMDAQIRSASRTGDAEINGVSISAAEAKELRGKPRRSAESIIVSQELRVVAIDTGEPAQMSFTLEDPVSGDRMRSQFNSKVVSASEIDILHEALKKRATAIFRMKMKMLDDERQIESVLSVSETPS